MTNYVLTVHTNDPNPADRKLLTSSTTDTVTAMIDTTLQALADHATAHPVRTQLTIDGRPAWTIVIDLTHSTQTEAAAAIADEGSTLASTFYWTEHHAARWEPQQRVAGG